MQRNQLVAITLGIITFGLASMTTSASGTYTPGGSGGNNYQMNKLIFYKKVTCNHCPFPSRGKSAEDAQALLQELSEDSVLSSKEQRATFSYLQRRFKLREN